MTSSRTRFRLSVSAGLALLLWSVFGSIPATQAATCGQINQYAQQRTHLGYIGLFGMIYTYDPVVPQYRSQFSVAHLYVFNDGSAHVEVGWYKGHGGQTGHDTATTSYFSTAQDALTPYQEHDYAAATASTYLKYETRWVGYDFGLQRDLWAVWADDFTTAKDTWPIASFPQGYGLSGGEVAAQFPATYSQLEMHARIAPSHQLQVGNGTWYDWTQANMTLLGDSTSDCEDNSYSLTWYTPYDDLLAAGTAP